VHFFIGAAALGWLKRRTAWKGMNLGGNQKIDSMSCFHLRRVEVLLRQVVRVPTGIGRPAFLLKLSSRPRNVQPSYRGILSTPGVESSGVPWVARALSTA